MSKPSWGQTGKALPPKSDADNAENAAWLLNQLFERVAAQQDPEYDYILGRLSLLTANRPASDLYGLASFLAESFTITYDETEEDKKDDEFASYWKLLRGKDAPKLPGGILTFVEAMKLLLGVAKDLARWKGVEGALNIDQRGLESGQWQIDIQHPPGSYGSNPKVSLVKGVGNVPEDALEDLARNLASNLKSIEADALDNINKVEREQEIRKEKAQVIQSIFAVLQRGQTESGWESREVKAEPEDEEGGDIEEGEIPTSDPNIPF